MCSKAFLILLGHCYSACRRMLDDPHGGIRMSREVTEQFEKLEVKPNYRYWYLNQENSPYGVAGLDREYRLDDDRMWQAVDPDTATFRKVVGLVQSFPLPNSYTSGFAITDRRGARSGSGTPAWEPALRWIRRPKSFQFPP